MQRVVKAMEREVIMMNHHKVLSAFEKKNYFNIFELKEQRTFFTDDLSYQQLFGPV
jgi:hypothetical protein